MRLSNSTREFYEAQIKETDKRIKINEFCRNPNPDMSLKVAHRNFPKCERRITKQRCNCQNWCMHAMMMYHRFNSLCKLWYMHDYFEDEVYLDCPDHDELREFIKIDDKSVDIRSLPRVKVKLAQNFQDKVATFNLGCLNNDHNHIIEGKFEKFKCAAFLIRSYCKGNEDCEDEFYSKGPILSRCIRDLKFVELYTKNVTYINPLTNISTEERMSYFRPNEPSEIVLTAETFVNETIPLPYIPPHPESIGGRYANDSQADRRVEIPNNQLDINIGWRARKGKMMAENNKNSLFKNSSDLFLNGTTHLEDITNYTNNHRFLIEGDQDTFNNNTRLDTSAIPMNPQTQLSFIVGVSIISLFLNCVLFRTPWNSRTSKICSLIIIFLLLSLGILGVVNF